MKNEFIEAVREAQRLAQIENIEANAIVINKKFVKTPRLYLAYDNQFLRDYFAVLPPMICGLEVYITDNELPENYSFAIMDCGKTERDRIAGKARLECAKEICFAIVEDMPTPIKEGWLKWFNERYGVEVE